MDILKKKQMQKDLTELTIKIHKEIKDFPSNDIEWMEKEIMDFFNKYNCERITLSDTGDFFNMKFD